MGTGSSHRSGPGRAIAIGKPGPEATLPAPLPMPNIWEKGTFAEVFSEIFLMVYRKLFFKKAISHPKTHWMCLPWLQQDRECSSEVGWSGPWCPLPCPGHLSSLFPWHLVCQPTCTLCSPLRHPPGGWDHPCLPPSSCLKNALSISLAQPDSFLEWGKESQT